MAHTNNVTPVENQGWDERILVFANDELVQTFIVITNRYVVIVDTLINEVTDATDVLTEEFIALARGVRKHTKNTASKSRIESALRRVYSAMNDYKKRSEKMYAKTNSKVRDVTDKIVDTIQEHIEHVIAIFVEFIQLSLQSVMNKAEMDMLYQRQQKRCTRRAGCLRYVIHCKSQRTNRSTARR